MHFLISLIIQECGLVKNSNLFCEQLILKSGSKWVAEVVNVLSNYMILICRKMAPWKMCACS